MTRRRTFAEWAAQRNADLNTPSPTLDEFMEWYADDGNTFWFLQAGDHQNLLDEAIDRLQDKGESQT